MALAMSRPWKHPTTGIYWLRKRVPDDLRAAVGKREEKFSLKTREPVEAKRLHAEALAALEQRWANLRAPICKLDNSELHRISITMYERCLELGELPGVNWDTAIGEHLWESGFGHKPEEPLFLSSESVSQSFLQAWCKALADEFISVNGLKIDDEDRLKIAKAISTGAQRAALTLNRRAKGDYSPDSSFPVATRANDIIAVDNPTTPVTLETLLEGWAAEKRPTEKTIYSWKRVLDQLVEFVGHTDAVRLTPDDLLRWKASLLDAGLRTKTIRDSKIAPVRAILQWGVDNRKLAANPAARIVIDVRSKMTERIWGFTDEEAALILRNAAKEKDPVRRWVPLLCAYSGARLSEVCQLRVEDVFQRGGVWCMKFDPEAGSLKNENSERAVPLHPAIVESGFPQFVVAARSGPLFTGLQADRFGNRGGNGTKTIGRWVRGLGLTDERLSPSHSWRHRFKTLGRQFGLAPDIVNAITGHLRKTVADSYGEFPMDALFREIAKIPAFDVT
jgi:integrase